jgi:hypothetical protein
VGSLVVFLVGERIGAHVGEITILVVIGFEKGVREGIKVGV